MFVFLVYDNHLECAVACLYSVFYRIKMKIARYSELKAAFLKPSLIS